MSGRLVGKVILVTGAAQGLGASIATAMAEQGARLFVSDVSTEGLLALAHKVDATPLTHDVTSEADWAAVAEEISRTAGKLDVLVNNAGVQIISALTETTLAQWRQLMAVNVDSLFIGCKTMLPLLVAAGTPSSPSCVINMSSVAGLVGFSDQVAYTTSKAAVQHFSKSLAVEWTAYGHSIRVNSIHPGCIRTSMLEKLMDDWAKAGVVDSSDPWGSLAAMTPLNTVGEPRDVAMGAVYLASDEAKYVTGTELVIDGGWVAR